MTFDFEDVVLISFSSTYVGKQSSGQNVHLKTEDLACTYVEVNQVIGFNHITSKEGKTLRRGCSESFRKVETKKPLLTGELQAAHIF